MPAPEGRSSVAIGLLGDVMLGRGVGEALGQVAPEDLWAPELRRLLTSLDMVVCNLECCISNRGAPTTEIAGKPFFFRAPPSAVRALRAIGVRVVSLANNHALDFGEDALRDTVELLHRAGIAAAGAGRGPRAARAPAVVAVADAMLGVVAVSDHPVQYAAATAHWGIAYAPLKDDAPTWLLEQIALAKVRCDLVLAVPHWGPNMTTRPASWQLRLARSLRAAGADLVVGHSAHVFHGIGWSDGPLLFDLGDALDDYRTDATLRNDLGVLAVWRPWGCPRLELLGLRLDYCHTRLAEGADAEWIASRLERACAELGSAVRRRAEQRFVVEPARPSATA